MLPMRNKVLQLGIIAEYWTREIMGIRTAAEIEAELLAAYWRGDLPVLYEGATRSIDRAGMLRAVNLKREHPAFSFIDIAQTIPPRSVKHSDGSVSIDVRRYIVLPSDQAQWTEDILQSAYGVLAKIGLEGFDPSIIPAFVGFAMTKEVLAEFCDKMGYDRPRFWFRATKDPVSFGGRPSAMRQIRAEMTRRADQHVLAPTLREEAKALLIWAKANINEKMQLPQPRSAENALREEYNKLRSTVVADEHKT